MTKRFVDGGEECIEDQFLIDTSNDKYYWVSDGLDDIVKLLNELHEKNEDLATKKEDAEYELLHLKEKYEELLKENKQLKQFIQELTIKGTGRINLANGYSYRVNAILSEIEDYIKDSTIEVKELPEKGDSKLIYTVNGLEYIYFKGQWECIGKK